MDGDATTTDTEKEREARMAEQLFLVDGAELHVEEGDADGGAVVLVHGLGLQGALWSRVGDAFGGRYRLVRVDLRGSPRSRERERRSSRSVAGRPTSRPSSRRSGSTAPSSSATRWAARSRSGSRSTGRSSSVGSR
jgi:pimeloyl-ACP methyl ester carboxylesterase